MEEKTTIQSVRHVSFMEMIKLAEKSTLQQSWLLNLSYGGQTMISVHRCDVSSSEVSGSRRD